MYELVLTACLAASPSVCVQRVLPAGAASDIAACEARAPAIAAGWVTVHPDLTAQAHTCVPASQLPASPVTALAPGVWVHQGIPEDSNPQNAGRIANLGIIVGSRAVAVIDAGATRAEGEALLAAVRRLTPLPLRYLIVTHMHPDHLFGAEVFAEAGASIIASARLPQALAARQDAYLANYPALIGAQAMAGTRIVPPDVLLEGPARLDLGGATLIVTPQPAAHTDNDLTVLHTQSGTLFTGDLVFRGLTPVVDGAVLGWLDWLAVPQDAGVLVPGHGPVAAGWDTGTRDTRAYLNALVRHTRAQIAARQSMLDAVPAIVAAMGKGEGEGEGEGWAAWTETTARNAAAVYKELEWQ